MGMRKMRNAKVGAGERAAIEVRRLCSKIAEQAGKAQWWNALANAGRLVVACQHGCQAEIAQVVKRQAARKKTAPKRKATKNKA